jgi:alpha-beta hydrolase superfamily lysophospholipase
MTKAPVDPPPGAEWLEAEGGERLYVSVVAPDGDPLGVVNFVVHPEIGSAPLYPGLMAALRAAGFATTVSHPRGSGYSSGLRGDLDDYQLFLGDHRRGLAHARSRFPGKPLFLMGHSAGAAFALELAAKTPEPIAGMVLVNPAFKLRATEGMTPSFGDYFVFAGNMVFRPGALTVDMNSKPSAVKHPADRAEGEAMQADPIVVRYFSMRYMLAQKQVMDRCATNAGTVSAPVLLLEGAEDGLIDPTGNDEILAGLKGDKTKLIVAGGGHGSSSVETMVEPIVEWLRARVLRQ